MMFEELALYWTKEGMFEDGHSNGVEWDALHKEDGPAFIVLRTGYMIWALGGEQMTQIEHFNRSPYFQSLPPAQRVLERLKIGE